MQVELVITSEHKTRYLLVDALGEPVRPVLQYLRFLDSQRIARNTLRTYCYHFKLFFEFLEEAQLDYLQVGIDDMGAFLRWLQRPAQHQPIIPLQSAPKARKPSSINQILATVLQFYEYLMIHEDYTIQLSQRLKKELAGSRRSFKDFLYHISKDHPFEANLLKLKTPKDKPKAVLKQTVQALIDACQNVRDEFLLTLLWEAGIRIGEALALWLEDVDISARQIHIRDRGELANGAEIKSTFSPRTLDVSEELINFFAEYVAAYHTEEVDTNHVFIKLEGSHRGQPLEYTDVASLFRRLERRLGIHVTPHMFRHGSFTALRKAGWKPEYLRKRAGHAYVQTTMQFYIHPDEADLHEDWKQTEERMKLRRKRREEAP